MNSVEFSRTDFSRSLVEVDRIKILGSTICYTVQILDLIPFRSYSRPEILDLIPFGS